MQDDDEADKIAQSAAQGCAFSGCAFIVASVLVFGIWVAKLIWHALFG